MCAEAGFGSSLDDRTALFEDSESVEQVITFAHSRGDLSPEDMFFEVPEVSPSAQIEAQQSAEPEPVAPASENPERSELPEGGSPVSFFLGSLVSFFLGSLVSFLLVRKQQSRTMHTYARQQVFRHITHLKHS